MGDLHGAASEEAGGGEVRTSVGRGDQQRPAAFTSSEGEREEELLSPTHGCSPREKPSSVLLSRSELREQTKAGDGARTSASDFE